MTNMSASLIGRGWAHPIGVGAHGGVAMASGVEDIEQAIHLILATVPGERPMRPEFGSRIHDFVFAPINISTMTDIAHEVRSALRRWEPRIDVIDVIVSPHDRDQGFLLIEIVYEVSATFDRYNLVFPFYTIPESD